MKKKDRFQAALAGGPVDRAPRTCWSHYMTETLGGEEHARRHLVFQREYDWDICKVVNDFQYSFPNGVETINGPEDMNKFVELGLDDNLFAEEIECCRILRGNLGPDTPIVFTTFDPLRQIVRRAGASVMPTLLEHREDTLRMLQVVSASMCGFMAGLREVGCDGVFFSLFSGNMPPSKFAVDDDVYGTFMRPFELEMLTAMEGMARIIHVHGAPVSLDRVIDYPVDAISVSDRIAGNPSLTDVRDATGKCVMGGVDETLIAEMTPDELRAQIKDTIQAVGDRGLILAPGCTIPVWTPAHLLRILGTV